MKQFTIKFLFFFFFFFPGQALFPKIWINEFMQSNIDCVRDNLQEFPDSWIELYNDSDSPVNISNWYLSLDNNYRNGYRINVYVSVPAKGYTLIYCDKVASGIHTSFRLESGNGGNIFLFDSSGNEIDKVTNIPKQPAPNIARGRISDGNGLWAYFVTPTIQKPNIGKTSSGLLPKPVFSIHGGIYKTAQSLSLSLPGNVPAGVTTQNIHYTLDGSEPTSGSASFQAPISLSKTTIVKAKIIHPDYLSDWSQTHSYIFPGKDLSLPVISICTDNEYLLDDEFGIYVKGNGKYGVAGNGVDYKANWNNDWRRPVNFEYFPVLNEGAVLNQLGEIRIAGGWSRANPQKSFIVYANKRFGEKLFDYQLFTEKPDQEIKSFMIRNSGNDFWWTHFRDAAIQLFMGGKVDIDYQAYQPAIFYLNGNYWGIQNLRERSDEDFVLANYGTEDIDMIENWWGELKAGDKKAYDELKNELRKYPNSVNVDWVMNQIDIDEFINYMILEIYVSNTDFPGNNVVLWKMKDNGKWRFILKDMDQGLGIWDTNPVSHNAMLYNTQYNNDWDMEVRALFNTLLRNNTFRKEFYSRFAIYMGNLLHYESTSHVIDSIQTILEPSMTDHLNRWMPEMWWRDLNSWKSEVTKMKDWCKGRNSNVYTHLRNYFGLGEVMEMKINTAFGQEKVPTIVLNGVTLYTNKFDGYYFRKEQITLSYLSADNASYKWKISETSNNTLNETYIDLNEFSYIIPANCQKLDIELIPVYSGIEYPIRENYRIYSESQFVKIDGLSGSNTIYIYDVQGRLINMLTVHEQSAEIPVNQKGIYVVKLVCNQGTVTQKVIVR